MLSITENYSIDNNIDSSDECYDMTLSVVQLLISMVSQKLK